MGPLLLGVRVDGGRSVSFKKPSALQRKVCRLPTAENEVRVYDLGDFWAHDVHVDELGKVEVHFVVGVGEQAVPDVVKDA